MEKEIYASKILDPVKLVNHMNELSRGRRGAVMVCFAIDVETGEATSAGIGNTSLRIYGLENFGVICQSGVLGQWHRETKKQKIQLHREDIALLYTDGIKSSEIRKHDLMDYRHLSAGGIARAVVDEFGKSLDDSSCVVVKVEYD